MRHHQSSGPFRCSTWIQKTAFNAQNDNKRSWFAQFQKICSNINYFHHDLAQESSQSFSTAYSIVGHGGAGAYLQQSMGERQGTPWTGRQSIAGQHTYNHAHTHSYT
ncbi:hypothetical protein XENORESO_008957 [Xenotaenia resolanae]|uniref:Uncharacterized protein n=1 Tax=Xenotaenia resolanae TaxID=208358 RepID=A0ABV0VQ49_9TELE